MNSTCNFSASLVNEWPPKDYWHSSQGHKLVTQGHKVVTKRTFLDVEVQETGLPEGLTRARSETALDEMKDKHESLIEFSACDNLNSRCTCSTKDSDVEDEKVQNVLSADEETELEEDGQEEVLQQEEEDKEDNSEYQRALTKQGEQNKVDQNLAWQGMGPCVTSMGSPNLMQQQSNNSLPVMMQRACSQSLCFYVPMSNFYPYGFGMEQAMQQSVNALGYPQQGMPQHATADELNARAMELHLAAEKYATAAQQMTAAANSQGIPSEAASMPSAGPSAYAAKGNKTTVMFRNLPNNQKRDEFAALLDVEGFAGLYDFLYLPWDFYRHAGLGYAFVNFIEPKYAECARSHFNGFSRWGFASEKVCQVCSSDRLDGLEAHVERYRNSPVMHFSVPEICKPLLLVNGVRTPMPPPTRPLKAPRMKYCAPVMS